MAFEVATLDEVIRARNHLKKHGVKVDFEGRRRAGVQIAVEFRDPDGHRLEIYWGLDRVKEDGYIRPVIRMEARAEPETGGRRSRVAVRTHARRPRASGRKRGNSDRMEVGRELALVVMRCASARCSFFR
jgi:hypothetical protein